MKKGIISYDEAVKILEETLSPNMTTEEKKRLLWAICADAFKKKKKPNPLSYQH